MKKYIQLFMIVSMLAVSCFSAPDNFDFAKMFESLLQELEAESKAAGHDKTTQTPTIPQASLNTKVSKKEQEQTAVDPTILSDVIALLHALEKIYIDTSTTLFENDSFSPFLASTRESFSPLLRQIEAIVRALGHFGKAQSDTHEKLYLSVLMLPKYKQLCKEIRSMTHTLKKLHDDISKLKDRNHQKLHDQIVKRLVTLGRPGELTRLTDNILAVVASPEAREKLQEQQKIVADKAAKELERQKKLREQSKPKRLYEPPSTPHGQQRGRKAPYSPYDQEDDYGDYGRYDASDIKPYDSHRKEPESKNDPQKETEKTRGGGILPEQDSATKKQIRALAQALITSKTTTKLMALTSKPFEKVFEDLAELYADGEVLAWVEKALKLFELNAFLPDEVEGDVQPKMAQEKQLEILKATFVQLQPLLVKLVKLPVPKELVEVTGDLAAHFPPITIAYQEKYKLESNTITERQKQFKALADHISELSSISWATLIKSLDTEVDAFEQKRNAQFKENLIKLNALQTEPNQEELFDKKIKELCEKLLDIPKRPTYLSASLTRTTYDVKTFIDQHQEELNHKIGSVFHRALTAQQRDPGHLLNPSLAEALQTANELLHRWGIRLNAEQARNQAQVVQQEAAAVRNIGFFDRIVNWFADLFS